MTMVLFTVLQSCPHCWYLIITYFITILSTIGSFLWSITNIFCCYCYCYSASKDLGKSCNYVAYVFLIIPHSWQTFLIYRATSSSNLSQHITLGSHYQCNWHYHVNWKVAANPTLGMYTNFLSYDTEIQLKIYCKK